MLIYSVLISVLLRVGPALDETSAAEHAAAMHEAAETSGLNALLAKLVPDIDGASLLAGMAYRESRFQQPVVSRMQCSGSGTEQVCKRVASVWRKRTKPKGAKGTYYCGVLQVGGSISWKRCLELIDDVALNYQVGADHLMDWLKDPHCAKKKGEARVVCALRGNGGGYQAIKNGTSTYPARVLKTARYIRKLSEPEPQS